MNWWKVKRGLDELVVGGKKGGKSDGWLEKGVGEKGMRWLVKGVTEGDGGNGMMLGRWWNFEDKGWF